MLAGRINYGCGGKESQLTMCNFSVILLSFCEDSVHVFRTRLKNKRHGPFHGPFIADLKEVRDLHSFIAIGREFHILVV